MEQWCILPDNFLQELLDEDNMVLPSLSRFCKTTKWELLSVLQKRNEQTKKSEYWYKKYMKQVGNKKREIREPHSDLKKVQDNIRDRLLSVPTSLACTAGNIGDSAEKNAELHRHNPYLITLDIKSAYPSIETYRVYKNFQGSLPLKIWTPSLELDQDKDLFVRAITHLCVAEDQLPQWASTSMQIQNIVMRGFDTKIEKKLPELTGSHMVYSRYADDITISFPRFSTYDVLEEKMTNYEKDLNDPTKEKIEEIMKKFPKDIFIITDNFELKYLQSKIISIKEKLQTNCRKWLLSEEQLYIYIWIINSYKNQIKRSNWRIVYIADEIIKIIGWEWRKINQKKVKMRTPQSNTDREINGLTFDHTGKRALNAKKKSQYIRLLDDLISFSLHKLSDNKYYERKFKIERNKEDKSESIEKILNTIRGVYGRLKSVYEEDNIPKDLLDMYKQAREKRENYSEPAVETYDCTTKTHEEGIKEPDDDLPF